MPAAAIRMLPRVDLEYAHVWCAAFALQARQADGEASLKDASAASCAQVHFGIKGRVSRERDLHSHGTNGTGRPPSAKQLLRIRAGPQYQTTTARCSAGHQSHGTRHAGHPRFGLARVEHFFGSGHGAGSLK